MNNNEISKQLVRERHQFDATDRIAGRLASETAILLMGKHKVTYRPNMDQGDFVEIFNLKKLKFSGKKIDKKTYFSYSGYPGGLKRRILGKFFSERPEEVFRKIVLRMLPKNKLRKEMIKRLTFKLEDK